MATDEVKLEIVNENNKGSDQHLDDEIDRIFGKPPLPNFSTNGFLNNLQNDGIHLNGNNKIGENDSEKAKQPLLEPPLGKQLPPLADRMNGNNKIGENDSEKAKQPLLEPPLGKQLPPLAGPEIDDLDGDPPKDATPYPGIDDGLLEHSDKKPEISDHDDGEHDTEHDSGDEHHTFKASNDGIGTDDTNGLGTRFGVDDRAISPVPGVIPDVNTYQQKKNLAQGMMDLALLSANANQLRYVLESSTSHPYYYSSVTFISLSVIIQILVGVGLIMNSRYDVNVHKEICKADKINNMTVLGIFLITIVNVFITSFSVATPTVSVMPAVAQSVPLIANSST
ncbi:unnamed protein product [Arctia plantaginis]|uniref:Ninjurin n=1 Tax=Arctia plantaginis TaxID=874455 RepID=A0A8S1B8Q2_ARCPL|nr:unnamed protein product [Arctia plantaginis]